MPKVFKAGCEQIRFPLQKNDSGFKAKIGLGKGHGTMELTRTENHQDLILTAAKQYSLRACLEKNK